MPAWSKKDRRQYEHIKESSQKRGAGEDRAEEIAARTVNKLRRKEGRTPNKVTMGTGNPKVPLEKRTVQQLQNLAAEMKIRGRTKMNKSELLEAIGQKKR